MAATLGGGTMRYEPGGELAPHNYQLLSRLKPLPAFVAYVLGDQGAPEDLEKLPLRTLLVATWVLWASADAQIACADGSASLGWLDTAVGMPGFAQAAVEQGLFRLADGVLQPAPSASKKEAAAERARRYRERQKLSSLPVATTSTADAPKATAKAIAKNKPVPQPSEDDPVLAEAFAASWAEHMSSPIIASASDTARSAKQCFAAINSARQKAGDPAAPAADAKRFFDAYLYAFSSGEFCAKLLKQHGSVPPLVATKHTVAARVVAALVRGAQK